MNAAHVAACSFEAWYARFEDVTFSSRILPLSSGMAEFLVQDGVFMPDSSQAMPRRAKQDEYAVEGVDYTGGDYDGASSDDGNEGQAAAAAQYEQFADFRREVDMAVADLGGRVLPKLNWSAPKDAVFMSNSQSTACANADEVLLLLQSSTRVADDICHAFDSCMGAEPPVDAAASTRRQQQQQRQQQPSSDVAGASASTAVSPTDAAGQWPGEAGAADMPAEQRQQEGEEAATPAQQRRHPLAPPLVLVLRRWRELRPGREFRCFVCGREVVGISQRDMTDRFDFLLPQQEAIEDAILNFHEDHIMAAFPLSDYTYDVYVTSRHEVKLIDFNPVGGSTSPLLFEDWAALGYAWAQPATSPASAGPADEGPHPTAAAAAADRAAAEPSQQQQHQQQQQSSQHAARADSHLNGSSGSGMNGSANGSGVAHNSSTRSGQDGSSRSNGVSFGPELKVDFRIITDPVVMRSAAVAYGAPADFADPGITGALADWARAQAEAQLRQ